MKNIVKILIGSLALTFGGVSSAAVASNVINNQPTAERVETADTNTDTSHNLVINHNTYFGNSAAAPTASESASGFDFVGMVTDGIKSGGTSLISSLVGKLGTMAFNQVLTSMGVDMRSNEEKKLDAISAQLDGIQKDLKQGISDIKRKMTQMRNETIMNGLLTKLSSIQTPVAGKMATMIDIGKKELNPSYDKNELAAEKETFYKGLADLKFENLNGNNLWNETENLAKEVVTPYIANTSINLDELYEETYGYVETWDYMTIAPRTKFLGYIGTLVNSLAQLANIKASYDMSKFKAGDSNLIDYQTGVDNMVKAVNSLNDNFKNKLEKLAAIQKKHDEQHLITHRERVVDKDGNISYKDGRTVSTRIYAVTSGDNDHNYISYYHDHKNMLKKVDFGYSNNTVIYANYIYTLDCTDNKDLYSTIFNEYNDYKTIVNNNNVTMQDYLYKAGFTCDDKDLFAKAKGFYSRIDQFSHKGGEDSWWKTDKHSKLRVRYYDFTNPKFEEAACDYSDARLFKDGWFASNQYSGKTTDNFNDYYLVFVNEDQKSLSGKITKTVVQDGVWGPKAEGDYYKNHFKGHRKWTGSDTDPVTIQ